MRDEKNILNDARLKQNPFKVPEGYFDSIEDRIRERISPQESPKVGFIAWVKPAFVLCIMFLSIAGLGLLASRITDKIYHDPMMENPIFALIDEGYLESSFIYSFYDEIDVEEGFNNSLENSSGLEEEIELTVESTLTQEELMEYLLENN